MAEIFTSYSVDNDKRFQRAIDSAFRKSNDLRIPLGFVSRDWYKSEKAIFILTTRGQYPPISEPYGTQKEEAIGFKYPLLVRTGRLSDSLLDPNAVEAIHNLGKASLEIGTETPYAIFHQSDKARSKIPLRKFLFIGPEAPRFANNDQIGRLERFVGYFQQYIEGTLKGAGRIK